MLGSSQTEFVHIHVFMGMHETINNQEDLKHYICFKFHPLCCSIWILSVQLWHFHKIINTPNTPISNNHHSV